MSEPKGEPRDESGGNNVPPSEVDVRCDSGGTIAPSQKGEMEVSS